MKSHFLCDDSKSSRASLLKLALIYVVVKLKQRAQDHVLLKNHNAVRQLHVRINPK